MPESDADLISVVALGLSLVAILFTVFSFWWMNARQGALVASGPQYVFGQYKASKLALQLPLALHNTGPRPIVVSSFRLRLLLADKPALLWVGFSTDPLAGVFSFKKPVVVERFAAVEKILYFQREGVENPTEPALMQLEAIWSGDPNWRVLASFRCPVPDDGWSDRFGGLDLIGGIGTGERLG